MLAAIYTNALQAASNLQDYRPNGANAYTPPAKFVQQVTKTVELIPKNHMFEQTIDITPRRVQERCFIQAFTIKQSVCGFQYTPSAFCAGKVQLARSTSRASSSGGTKDKTATL